MQALPQLLSILQKDLLVLPEQTARKQGRTHGCRCCLPVRDLSHMRSPATFGAPPHVRAWLACSSSWRRLSSVPRQSLLVLHPQKCMRQWQHSWFLVLRAGGAGQDPARLRCHPSAGQLRKDALPWDCAACQRMSAAGGKLQPQLPQQLRCVWSHCPGCSVRQLGHMADVEAWLQCHVTLTGCLALRRCFGCLPQLCQGYAASGYIQALGCPASPICCSLVVP